MIPDAQKCSLALVKLVGVFGVNLAPLDRCFCSPRSSSSSRWSTTPCWKHLNPFVHTHSGGPSAMLNGCSTDFHRVLSSGLKEPSGGKSKSSLCECVGMAWVHWQVWKSVIFLIYLHSPVRQRRCSLSTPALTLWSQACCLSAGNMT